MKYYGRGQLVTLEFLKDTAITKDYIVRDMMVSIIKEMPLDALLTRPLRVDLVILDPAIPDGSESYHGKRDDYIEKFEQLVNEQMVYFRMKVLPHREGCETCRYVHANDWPFGAFCPGCGRQVISMPGE